MRLSILTILLSSFFISAATCEKSEKPEAAGEEQSIDDSESFNFDTSNSSLLAQGTDEDEPSENEDPQPQDIDVEEPAANDEDPENNH